MKESMKDMFVFLGITIALYGVFITTISKPEYYLFWVTSLATLFFSLATIFQMFKVLKDK